MRERCGCRAGGRSVDSRGDVRGGGEGPGEGDGAFDGEGGGAGRARRESPPPCAESCFGQVLDQCRGAGEGGEAGVRQRDGGEGWDDGGGAVCRLNAEWGMREAELQ